MLCTEVAYAKREVVLRQRFRGTEIGSARRAAVLSKGMQEEKKFEEKLKIVRETPGTRISLPYCARLWPGDSRY